MEANGGGITGLTANTVVTKPTEVFDDTDLRWRSLSSQAFYSTPEWLDHCRQYEGGVCVGVGVAKGAASVATALTQLKTPPVGNYDVSAKYGAAGLAPPVGQIAIVGPRLGYAGSILRTPGASDQLVRELVEQIRETAHGGAPVAMYLPSADVRALLAAGIDAEPIFLEPEAWFRLPVGGWEGYLASLKASRRRVVRHEVRALAIAGVTITHHPLAEVVGLLPALAESMAIKYGYLTRADGFAREFAKYEATTGRQGRVAMGWHNGAPIGFCLYYAHGDCIWLRWASFNYEKLVDAYEYFNLSYYSQIHVASQVGATCIHAGKNALPAKVLRGASLTPMWMLDLSPKPTTASRAQRAAARQANAASVGRILSDPLLARAIEEVTDWTEWCEELAAT